MKFPHPAYRNRPQPAKTASPVPGSKRLTPDLQSGSTNPNIMLDTNRQPVQDTSFGQILTPPQGF